MKGEKASSPHIDHVSWGRLIVEGFRIPFKDAKLFPGGAREWDWGETGTRHIPGIQPADIYELLEHGSTAVVLSQGMQEALQVMPETLRHLKENGVVVEVLPTKEAVIRYNELRLLQPTGALIHSTC